MKKKYALLIALIKSLAGLRVAIQLFLHSHHPAILNVAFLDKDTDCGTGALLLARPPKSVKSAANKFPFGLHVRQSPGGASKRGLMN